MYAFSEEFQKDLNTKEYLDVRPCYSTRINKFNRIEFNINKRC